MMLGSEQTQCVAAIAEAIQAISELPQHLQVPAAAATHAFFDSHQRGADRQFGNTAPAPLPSTPNGDER